MESKKNLVLLGFMGSGKSTIGSLLAIKLNLDFIDVDHQLEKEEGILVGHSSAAAMLGALKLAAKIESGIIVTVFPDSCERCYVNFGQLKKYYETQPDQKLPKAD